MTTLPQLPLPPFYDPKNAEDPNYRPNIPMLFEVAQEWRKKFSIKPSASDVKKIVALLIDLQNSFCNKHGTLFVGGRSGNGSVDDARRTAEFIYHYLYLITALAASLDTHLPWQIFLRSCFNKRDGSPVGAMTMISAAELDSGEYQVTPLASFLTSGNYTWLRKQMVYYCQEVEKRGYKLMIWPEHCFLGDWGHNLLGIILEAILFHSYVRGAQPDFQIKGGNPLTENYSILRPEVLTRFDGHPLAQKNTKFLNTLLGADYLLIPGMQAGSHCGAWTVDDLLTEIVARDASLAKKVYIAEDCTSPVVVPGIVDFTDQQVAALDRFRNAGMHVVKSTDAVDSWPGLVL